MKNFQEETYLKKGLAGTLFLGTATLPQPLQALTTEAFAAAPKRAKRIVLISLDGILCCRNLNKQKHLTWMRYLQKGFCPQKNSGSNAISYITQLDKSPDR